MADNIFKPGHHNAGIEQNLDELPDAVANALERWRMASLQREKLEALLYLRFKADAGKRTSDELKAMVKADGGHYSASLAEIKAEIEYNRLYERLLSTKKLASLRTAF